GSVAVWNVGDTDAGNDSALRDRSRCKSPVSNRRLNVGNDASEAVMNSKSAESRPIIPTRAITSLRDPGGVLPSFGPIEARQRTWACGSASWRVAAAYELSWPIGCVAASRRELVETRAKFQRDGALAAA